MRFIKAEVIRLIQRVVVPNSRILDIGCGDGEVLQQLQATYAQGIDLDQDAIGKARVALPQFTFTTETIETFEPAVGQVFDYILLSGVVEQLDDIHSVFQKIRSFSTRETRLVIVSYSRAWQPMIRLAELFHMRRKSRNENWIPPNEIENLLAQSHFELVSRTPGILVPIKIPLFSRSINRWIAPLPFIRAFAAVTVTVARNCSPSFVPKINSIVSVVVAARNEAGNIRELVRRLPVMSENQELIFVEGNSLDKTWDEINSVISESNGLTRNIRLQVIKQPGIGKGDAVRAGFQIAQGDILIVLDADLSVPPEELPRFIEILQNGVCEFANGSRLLYPMERNAMQFLNILGNRLFGIAFTFLLGQQVRDTLCGTKALWASDYRKIVLNRSHFGDFDPFGDFDLLFGASRLNLRIRDVPVHYKERTYGATNISRFRHGFLLIRMSMIAARRLRFV
jgi:ubiquinone/menaquinone biosynthesis C-methylase UbiE